MWLIRWFWLIKLKNTHTTSGAFEERFGGVYMNCSWLHMNCSWEKRGSLLSLLSLLSASGSHCWYRSSAAGLSDRQSKKQKSVTEPQFDHPLAHPPDHQPDHDPDICPKNLVHQLKEGSGPDHRPSANRATRPRPSKDTIRVCSSAAKRVYKVLKVQKIVFVWKFTHCVFSRYNRWYIINRHKTSV